MASCQEWDEVDSEWVLFIEMRIRRDFHFGGRDCETYLCFHWSHYDFQVMSLRFKLQAMLICKRVPLFVQVHSLFPFSFSSISLNGAQKNLF